ncbi:hypothetical protein KR009_011782, partial [Drosophila setifemur]
NRHYPLRHPHPHAGDYEEDDEDDPRRLGILSSISCRRHRERLRSKRQSRIVQGLTIFVAGLTVFALLLYLALEMAGDQIEAAPENQEPQREESLESQQGQQQGQVFPRGVLRLLGLELDGDRDGDGDSSKKASCNPQSLDMRRIFKQISRQVLNQDQALARMERALGGNRRFRSVALLGPPGVGKTLSTNVLRMKFPWPANAHAYSWSTKVPEEEVGKFRMVRQFVDRLSDCGANLLIIDNLSPCDHGLVPIFNRLVLEREGDANANQTVLVVYVFNLETDLYWDQFELLQQLPQETTIVSFRFFGRDDLLDCLVHELRVEHRTLSRAKQSLVLEEAMANAHGSGCKSLRLLVLQHGVRV